MVKKYWIEGFRFRMNKYESEETSAGTTTTFDNDGGIELGVNLRGWFPTKANCCSSCFRFFNLQLSAE
jgi:hypothetical protein